ncbi:MerR family transcriptional regulator [Staphylococcus schleiferi]|uniref:Transcriptional regulator, MerR family protein n=1 Tax=Staphylococcus schleiferi TaxID=1295 RepID=A0A7Z7QND6_STASC|nr:MerR family transcriptional regulator [Staphylococcus schleiferi]RTX78625.1 MerR family transcriptional regulator [Staphylococcus schleiferi subsp. schleiferi]CAD7359100.1 transcriptional regulator, MerR family protein [Staphylococcus schleiferi]SUM87593.1 transcriptional regulator, MerR family protein [Staphylococcus schleiferi]
MEYEYRIKDIIKITGVTKRTLHYYDEIGLLSPEKNENHHRVYTQHHLMQLQKILLLRSMDVSIKRIIKIMAMDETNLMASLTAEMVILNEKIERLEKTKKAVAKWIEGVPVLEIDELNNNLQAQYQEEAKIKYGNTSAYRSFIERNGDYQLNSVESKNKMVTIFKAFNHLIERNVSDSEVYEVVKAWKDLMNSYAEFDDETLCCIAMTYNEDERFKDYFKQFGHPQLTEFIDKAVHYHLA